MTLPYLVSTEGDPRRYLIAGRDTRRVVSAVAAVQRWARVWCNT